MKYLKNFEMKYLKNFENADSVFIKPSVVTHYKDSDAYPFAWDDLFINVIVGKNRLSHDDSNIDLDYPFAGRIWIDRKVIAFWYYPDKDIFIKMINDLEKQLDISIWNNGYLIEIIVGDSGEIIKDEGETYEYDGAIYRELIPLEEYKSSGDSPEEERIVHLMNAKEKEQYYKKHGKPRGWGSDLKAKKNPIWWEQAKRTSEKFIMTFEKYTKMEWEILTSNPEKKIEGQRLIDIVQNAYRKSDMGAFVKTMADVLKSHWLVIDCDEYDDIDACIFYRTPRKDENWRGYKIQGIGHDGDPKAKELVLNKLKSLLRKPGYWIECSGKLEISLSNNNLNVVSEEDLQKLFPKSKIDMFSDGRYKRTLGNDWIKETTFGNPLF